MKLLVLHPDPRLHQPATELPPRAEWPALATELIEAMEHYGGLGLAAIQLGMPYRCLAMRLLAGKAVCFFEPRVIRSKGPIYRERESCLSIPGVEVIVARPWCCTIEARIKTGERLGYGFNGLQARTFLHELDHLDGKLILDYGPPAPKEAA